MFVDGRDFVCLFVQLIVDCIVVVCQFVVR